MVVNMGIEPYVSYEEKMGIVEREKGTRDEMVQDSTARGDQQKPVGTEKGLWPLFGGKGILGFQFRTGV